MPSLRHTNDVVVAYVACGSRIRLYALLDKLGERALYCDTDSVIFVQKADEPHLIECGDAFGDTTSELKWNEYISEFVSWGRKNYAYKLRNSVTEEVKTVCKVRCITLNYKASQHVNLTRKKHGLKRAF